MTQKRPQSGELYKHFKNGIYQIITIAKHSEKDEELVIYQALYGTYGIYARPLKMFVSEVDNEKYPKVTQKYRFEKVGEISAPFATEGMQNNISKMEEKSVENVVEQGANPKLIAFLDTNTMEEKYRILASIESEITDHLINDFAVALDVVIPEGELGERYNQLKKCVSTLKKYETNRLR